MLMAHLLLDQGLKVRKVHKVQLDLQVLQAQLVLLVPLVLLVQQELRGPLVRKGLQALMVLMVLTVQLDLKDLKGHKELLDLREQQEPQGLPVPLALQAQMVLMAQLQLLLLARFQQEPLDLPSPSRIAVVRLLQFLILQFLGVQQALRVLKVQQVRAFQLAELLVSCCKRQVALTMTPVG